MTSLVVDAITLGSLYVLVALGYVLIYSVLRIFHLVHGDVLVLGGMIAIGVLAVLGVPAGGAGAVAVVAVAVVAAACACGGLSWAIDSGVYRHIRSRSRLTPLLAALGLALILENLMMLVISKDPVAFPSGAIPDGHVTVAGTRILFVSILVTAAALLLVAALALFVNRSRLGIAMRAVAQDPGAAELVGLPTRRVIGTTFLIAGALAGVGGVLFAMHLGSLKWSTGLLLGIKGFSAALIGGLGSIAGAALGAFVLAFAEVFGVGINIAGFQLDSSWRDAIGFALVIAVLLFRPQGLLGSKVQETHIRN